MSRVLALRGALIILLAALLLGGTYRSVRADGPVLPYGTPPDVANYYKGWCQQVTFRQRRESTESWQAKVNECTVNAVQYWIATTGFQPAPPPATATPARRFESSMAVEAYCIEQAKRSNVAPDAWVDFVWNCISTEFNPNGWTANRESYEGWLQANKPGAKPAAPPPPAVQPATQAETSGLDGIFAAGSGIMSVLKWLIGGIVWMITGLYGLLGWTATLVIIAVFIIVWGVVSMVRSVTDNGAIYYKESPQSRVLLATPGRRGDLGQIVSDLLGQSGNNLPAPGNSGFLGDGSPVGGVIDSVAKNVDRSYRGY